MMMMGAIGMMVFLSACTDTAKARWSALGDAAHVVCYSGGKVIYDGFSTGKVERSVKGADGFRFKDQKTQRYREVSGDCNVDYGARATNGSSGG